MSGKSTDGTVVAGVDVGGTNIEVGLVDGDHEVVAREKAPTPTSGPDGVFDTIAELVGAVGGDPVAVGVGIPGVVHEGQVLTVPNLEGWSAEVDLVGGLSSRLDAPVTLGNDANVGLLGEWVAGAAKGARDVLGLWMGTGIGGGLILDGRPYEGSRGSAGEIGHVLVQPGGALCSCGRRGCVEAYAGRRMMSGAASAMVEAGWKTHLFEIREDEDKPRLTSKVWATALDEEDALAEKLVGAAVEHLGVAVGSVVNLLDVELVVVGGGLPEKLGQDLADRVEAAARPWMLRPEPHPTD
ncbi:ROK family protein [Pseudokineococcus basanitobsidens]|uniref:ROK family protein n=1 Tax=Pseudokineococcus basanitobsidens TaxID=1926649 RepID=A0ABU8RGC3_9ACTN